MRWIEADFGKALTLGEMGEMIVLQYLHNSGCEVWRPAKQGPHKCDLIFMRGGKIYAGDVKTKPKMQKYHATGVDVYHYREYLALSGKLDGFWLFFVDPGVAGGEEAALYGGRLAWLDVPHASDDKAGNSTAYPAEICKGASYTARQQGIRLWGLGRMEFNMPLDKPIAAKLHALSQSNYKRAG